MHVCTFLFMCMDARKMRAYRYILYKGNLPFILRTHSNSIYIYIYIYIPFGAGEISCIALLLSLYRAFSQYINIIKRRSSFLFHTFVSRIFVPFFFRYLPPYLLILAMFMVTISWYVVHSNDVISLALHTTTLYIYSHTRPADDGIQSGDCHRSYDISHLIRNETVLQPFPHRLRHLFPLLFKRRRLRLLYMYIVALKRERLTLLTQCERT